MDDWEEGTEDLVLKKQQPLKNSWDDEDVDDAEVKESWEDEDPAPVSDQEPPLEKAAPKAKTPSKKGKPVEVVEKTSVTVGDKPLDPLAEKLHQQRLVEEADYKSAQELFGKRGDDKTLDNFIPKSESDFMEYAELVSHKLRPYERSFHYVPLLKAVIRSALTTLKASDAKEIASSITAIANEKLKAEKEANIGKKKTGAKKKQLHVDKPDDDVVLDTYDALDDYDFM